MLKIHHNLTNLYHVIFSFAVANLDDLQWTLLGPVWVSVQIRKFLQERVAVEKNKALMVCLSDHLN